MKLTGKVYNTNRIGSISINENKIVFNDGKNKRCMTYSTGGDVYKRIDNRGKHNRYIFWQGGKLYWYNLFSRMDTELFDIHYWNYKELFIGIHFIGRPYPRADKELTHDSMILELDEKSQIVFKNWITSLPNGEL